MLSILITIIISFIISSLFGYIVHWALHQSWMGKLNNKHMTHHLIMYPPNDFTSDVYRNAGKDNSVFTFALLAIPLIIIPIILGFLNILPLLLVIIVLAIMGMVGFLSNYLHDAFHINNHFLTKFKLFNYWKSLHKLHHFDMSVNFGIFSFYWDRIFKTFCA